jgi:hypothetical protein
VGRASAFSFLRFCKKKVPAVAGAFFAFLRAFLRGSGENCGFLRGDLWWIRGGFVVICGQLRGVILQAKTRHGFEIYFPDFSFWE